MIQEFSLPKKNKKRRNKEACQCLSLILDIVSVITLKDGWFSSILPDFINCFFVTRF